MGERCLTVVQVDHQYRVAQYSNWESHPRDTGIEILKFLRRMDRAAFMEGVRAVRLWTNEEIQARQSDYEDIPSLSRRFFYEVPRAFKKRWPELKTIGSRVLAYIADQPPGIDLENRLEFAADCIFCEYVYVVDLDANTYEVFGGMRTIPLPKDARFAFLNDCVDARSSGYYPVALIGRFSLSALPSDEDFLQVCREGSDMRFEEFRATNPESIESDD